MLTFAPDTHTYYWNGAKCDNVTTVLSSANLIDYSAIPEYIREQAMDRGTDVHEAVHMYDKLTGNTLVPLEDIDWPGLPAHIRPYVSAYITFRKTTGFIPLENELRGYNSEFSYAGTLDLIGKMPDGRILLIDHKSGSDTAAAAIQTAAYSEFDLVKKFYPVVERHSLQLRPDGIPNFSLPYTNPFDFVVFKSALNIHRWKEAA